MIYGPNKPKSTNRLLIQTVWPFLLIIIVLLGATLFSLKIMTAVRAYVAGESLYSKAQKQAHISLINYLHSKSNEDYEEFLTQINIPLGDMKARIALQQAEPDLKTAYEGFVQGRNHSTDIPNMIFLFRYFSETPLMKEPIEIWTDADQYVIQTLVLGKEIHHKLSSKRLSINEETEFIWKLDSINADITPLEEAFSFSLAKTSHQIDLIISNLLVGITLFLMALGLIFSHRLTVQRSVALKQLQREAEKNLAFLRSASDGIHILDAQGNIQEASDSFCEMLGYSRDQIMGMNVTQWDVFFDPQELLGMLKEYSYQNERLQFETVHQRKDGSLLDIELSLVPVEQDEKRLIFCSSRDISERKQHDQQVERLAYHDQLTGLPNRLLFEDFLNKSLATSKRYHDFGAVLFIDLDKFKNINDVYGHSMGDELLKKVAQRLSSRLRKTDTVSRIAGDEFVALLPSLSTDQNKAAIAAMSIAEELRVALAEPINIDQHNCQITASIGVSVFPKDSENFNEILQEADIAMYRAKQNGRNTLIFFEHEMHDRITERFTLEQELRNALQNDELELYLQSQVDKEGTMIGAECLVRWMHPTKGLIPPDDFIPLAEETGQVVKIGEWVLSKACQTLSQLPFAASAFSLSVNISAQHFQQAGFIDFVKQVLAESGADPRHLILEITESLLIQQPQKVIADMQTLADLGIRFSIDDFGTGYSSLSYLKRMPLNELKIDKSFVNDIPDDANDSALIQTILAMAHHLGYTVVAEGVETQTQHNFLASLGCELYQGYLFHKPQPYQEWLNNIASLKPNKANQKSPD
ncbi:putative bifunctional diguanylate cyclase/phosphodiesterase [Thiomicrorhabdus sediminis]|uniref:cyclic-guanylate-specific phosphodiesterase n=1 Tax=Thiomicrorhabdus sediminis TaxID=2580412 RepID=A0A4P9K3I9_9GAMM|nr:GGDEF domain-containing phosphodiesterase [Thiomicrorhabdus sediminis]QCU89442.1 EAL domain-containing protein [Thiomicrorhabdus sediminis]